MTLSPIRLEAAAITGSPGPLSLALAKAHCSVDASETEFDTLFDLYIDAAIAWAEGETQRSLVARQHVWTLRDFPRAYGRRAEIWLPRGKTQSVASIAYTTSAGAVTTITGPSSGSPSGTGWREELGGEMGGVLAPPRDEGWPSDVDCDAPAPVRVTFRAGWEVGEMPADMTRALMFAVSDMFELRGAADWKEAGGNFSFCETLVSGFRLPRIYG